jgi:hypothetical protein
LANLSTSTRSGLDLAFDQLGDLARIGHHHSPDQRGDLVIEIPGIGGGFNHQDIRLAQILLGPGRPFAQIHPPGWQDDHHLGIQTAHHHIMLVQVDGQVAFIA